MTPPPPTTDYAGLRAELHVDGWTGQPPGDLQGASVLLDPSEQISIEIANRHDEPHVLLHFAHTQALIADMGPRTPNLVIAAASRALLQAQPGWVNPLDTIWDLDFTQAPPAEQRLLPAIGYTHPCSIATAYLHPNEDAYQGASWTVHGPDDAWVVTLAPGITGTMIAAILNATYRPRDLTAGEPPVWTDAHVTLDGHSAYPCKLGRLTAHGPNVPRFSRATMSQIIGDWHTLHLRHAAAGAPETIWDLAWNGENVAVRIFRPGALDEHGNPKPDLHSYEPDGEGFYHFGAGLLGWQVVEAP